MIVLNIKIKENYSKDGKDLSQLIQEWIKENTLYCISKLEDYK